MEKKKNVKTNTIVKELSQIGEMTMYYGAMSSNYDIKFIGRLELKEFSKIFYNGDSKKGLNEWNKIKYSLKEDNLKYNSSIYGYVVLRKNDDKFILIYGVKLNNNIASKICEDMARKCKKLFCGDNVEVVSEDKFTIICDGEMLRYKEEDRKKQISEYQNAIKLADTEEDKERFKEIIKKLEKGEKLIIID